MLNFLMKQIGNLLKFWRESNFIKRELNVKNLRILFFGY